MKIMVVVAVEDCTKHIHNLTYVQMDWNLLVTLQKINIKYDFTRFA